MKHRTEPPFSYSATLNYIRHDQYEYSKKVSRWTLLKWLIKGKFRLEWLVATDQSDKSLKLEGKHAN